MTPASDEIGAAVADPASTPSLARRMACFVYEATLLFGVALIPGVLGAVFVAQTGHAHVLQSDAALRLFALLLYGVYFVWLWSTRGQTLAMQTWRLRLVAADGSTVTQKRALIRYIACCAVWFGPAALLSTALHLTPWPSLGAFSAGIVVYALSALAAPGRQFWHDRWCGTRLVDVRASPEALPLRPRPR